MGTRFAFAFAFALAACEGEAPPEPEPCPAAGPCEDGQEPTDAGHCDLEAGTWTPCATPQDAGEPCEAFNDFDDIATATTCAACAEDWLQVDLARTTITCPDLPHNAVVVAD
jgi:hypothetical protein